VNRRKPFLKISKLIFKMKLTPILTRAYGHRNLWAVVAGLSLSMVALGEGHDSLSVGSDDSGGSHSDDSSSHAASSSNPSSDDGSNRSWSSSYDSSKLEVQNDNSARVSLISQDSGFRNTLGVKVGEGDGNNSARAVFGSGNSDDESRGVSVGNVTKGTKLNFFLLADEADGQRHTIAIDGSASTSALHAAGLAALSSTISSDGKSPYLVLTINETLNDGSGQTRQARFQLALSSVATSSLVITPEPSLYLTLGAFGAFGVWTKRRYNAGHALAR
jgi:hypothetical protein